MVLGFVGDVTAVGQNVVDSHVGNASASLQYLEVARLPLLVVALYHDPCESNEFCYEVNKRRVKVVMLVLISSLPICPPACLPPLQTMWG